MNKIIKKIKSSWDQLWNKIKAQLPAEIAENAELKYLEEQSKQLSPKLQKMLQTLVKNGELKSKVELNPVDKLCAQVTYYSYLEPEQRPYQIGDFYLETMYNSLFHCVYINHQEKICIVGYRGTDPRNKHDIISDAQLILGINAIDPRVTSSLELYDQLRKSHHEYQKWITGHSLGGTICYILAKHRQIDHCATFNAGAAPNKVFIMMLKDTLFKKKWTWNIYSYKILWDPISTFSYVGKTTSFRIPQLNPLKLHTIRNFLEDEVLEIEKQQLKASEKTKEKNKLNLSKRRKLKELN